MTRTLLLNLYTGTYHVHRNCKAITPEVEKHLVVKVVDWKDVPNLKCCGWCMPS